MFDAWCTAKPYRSHMDMRLPRITHAGFKRCETRKCLLHVTCLILANVFIRLTVPEPLGRTSETTLVDRFPATSGRNSIHPNFLIGDPR